ncbi:MAG: TIGR01777 family oxidoreductase [Planctomycetota bacterium]
MRIAITGSTGLVGSAVVEALLADGHEVVRMARPSSAQAARDRDDGTETASWDPSTGEIDVEAFGAVEAVVHLAGENVAGGRWTEARRRRIHESRGPATEALCRTLAALPQPPAVLVSASATGIYGDRGDEQLDERSEPGPSDDFLTRVALAWEAGTRPLAEHGTRVVNLRIGIVLDRAGGALAKMLTPFRLGLGGRLGDGKHWMSWITRHDLVRVVQRALTDEQLRGPVLAVAPTPVTNAEYTRTLGKVLGRPTIFPVPRFALRLLFGDLADVLLGSQRARPHRLLEAGFEFAHANLDTALTAALGKNA